MHASPASATPRGTPSRRGKSPLVGSHSPTGSASGSMSLPTDVSIKPTATFTTCLSIPVGSVPIDSGEEPETSAQPNHSKNERAPRTSKTNALAALQTHAQSSSSGDADMCSQESEFRFINNERQIPVSPILDISSVKSTSPRHMPSGHKGRPFGLQDCPVFYPTVEEFKDPMVYVRSISGTAQNYGICKVIPPVGWKMPFMTDTEVDLLFIGYFIITEFLNVTANRIFDSKLVFNASILSRHRLELNLTFLKHYIAFISNRATHECLYLQLITNRWIFGC